MNKENRVPGHEVEGYAGEAKCCHGCAQRDEYILKLERAITSAIYTLPPSMGGHVTLALNILQGVAREFQFDE